MPLRALPALSDNYIWLLSDDRGRALVVDPGEAAPVIDALADDRLTPEAILLTHHHPDHIAGTAQLLQQWPELTVIAPVDDRIAVPARRVVEGELLDIASWTLRVMEVPGHTLSHVAFVVESPGQPAILFCGDTLFSLGCGRLFEGTPEQMQHSLARLAGLPDDCQVCCGHEYTLANAAFAAQVEPDNTFLQAHTQQIRRLREQLRPTLPSSLELERACNPFLRWDSPAVRQTVSQRLGRPTTDPVETFAELRRWKDGFKS